MEAPFILFDSTSANNDSPVFLLDGQHTVVAVGLQPGDTITFEVITMAEGARANVCGCRIVGGLAASVEGLQQLLCPSCESEGARAVALTAANPVVVLDAPQNSFIRAIFSGTGLGLRTVSAWVTKSASIDLTDAMRGCPPQCCEDEEETWSPTGLHRCGETTVEIEEISNCGNKRWTECGAVMWTPTGNVFCTDSGGGEGGEDDCVLQLDGFDGGSGYYAEVRNQCGQTRWELVCGEGSSNYYTETGLIRCQLTANDPLEGTVYEQVTNPCGRASWRVRGPMTFTGTGNTRCFLGGEGGGEGFYENEVRDDCGNLHWAEGGSLTWVETGNTRCTSNAYEVEERSQPCGLLRWREEAELVWSETGNFRCAGVYIEREERNQCGTLRWTLTGTSVTWQPTNNTRCTEAGFEREEIDTCGQTRWVATGGIAWEPTGNYDCRSNVNWREERNQCGTLRWINTGEACGSTTHTMTYLTPQASDVMEGQNACWNIVLNSSVIGTPLTIEFDLSGADQMRNNYPTPRSVTIPVGQSTATLCIATTDDTVVDGTEQLCVTPRLTARLTNSPGTSCINVLDNDVPAGASTHTVTWGGEGPDDVTEGEEACWDIELDAPVTVTPLNLVFDWQGTDAVRNGYPNSTVTIAVGDSTGTLCLTTTDDTDIDGTEVLCPVLLPNVRVTSGPGASCINVLDNDIAASVHEVTCVDPPVSAVEGTLFCWDFTLDAPVSGAPLTVTSTLSGSEQGVHGYAAPSVVVPIGQDSGTLCVQSIDDNNVEPTRQLCLTINTSSRITAVNDVPCGGGGGQASLVFTNVVGVDQTISEGQTLNVRVSLSAPAGVGGVSGTIAFSGSEKTAYPAEYPNINWTVAEGSTFTDYPVVIFNDPAVDGNTALYGTLTVGTAGWTLGVPWAGATVLDNDAGGGGGGGGGGVPGCYLTGTQLRAPTGYVTINSLLPGDELLAFALPDMPTDFDGNWAAWRTSSLKGLSYLATRVKSNTPFTEEGAVRINGGPPTTAAHRYFVFDGTEYGWRRAADLDTRHSLVTMDGLVPVTEVEHKAGAHVFFKLDVEAPDTLIARTPYGDVFAHNLKCDDCPDGGGTRAPF